MAVRKVMGNFDPDADFVIEYVDGKPKRTSRSGNRESPWKKWLRKIPAGTTALIDVYSVYPDAKESRKKLTSRAEQVRSQLKYNAARVEFDYEIWQEANHVYVYRKA